jgi:hypothetical protein
MGVSANWKVQLQRYRRQLSSWRFLICHLLLLPCTLLLPPPSATATTVLPEETDLEAFCLKVFAAIVIVSRIRRWTQGEVDKLLLLLGVFIKGFLTMGFQVCLFIHSLFLLGNRHTHILSVQDVQEMLPIFFTERLRKRER